MRPSFISIAATLALAIAALTIPVANHAQAELRLAQAPEIKTEGETPGRLRGLRPPPSPQQRETRQQFMQECLAQLPADEREAVLARLREHRDARRTERRQAMASLSPAERAQLQAERRRLLQDPQGARRSFAANLTAEERERLMAQRAARRAQRQAQGPQDRCARLIQRLRAQS
jgi:hypothetical protein